MAETFLPLTLPAGISRNGTKYQNKNRWYDANLVRFHGGAIRPVGGWSTVLTSTSGLVDAEGTPRGAHSWRDNDGSSWLGVGTTGVPSKLYAFSGGVLTDITPAGLVNGRLDGGEESGSGNYSADGYGNGVYGTGSTSTVVVNPDTWTLDNFGENLVACLTGDGKLYSWDTVIANDAVQVTNSPTGNAAVVVTPERFVFALGCSGDPRLVKWASQESLTDWTPSASNSAGDFTLQTNGRLVAGKRTARETLLWTDADLWSANYIGGQFVYGFNQRGDHCGLLGAHAVAAAEGAVYWMGNGQFFVYDGAVRTIPCEVLEYVFGDLRRSQLGKVTAVPIPMFSEVWWFYPSAEQSSLENNRYVAYNYREQTWTIGKVGRAAGVGPGVFTTPLLWSSAGLLYAHETGTDHGADLLFLETGPLELDNGDRVVRIQKMIPDENVQQNGLRAIFFSSFYPLESEVESSAYTLSPSTDVRVTGRQFRIRFEEPVTFSTTTIPTSIETSVDFLYNGVFLFDSTQSFGGTSVITGTGSVLEITSALGTDWRVGNFRLGVVAGGLR